MLDLISFLTQIPVRRDVSIERVKAKSHLFPFVGLLIGLTVAVVAFLSFGFLSAATEIAASLTLLALYLLTGLLHLDGLADFFDGVMAPGSREDKIRAMKDENIGVAGLFAGISVLLLSLFAIKSVGADLTVAGFNFNLLSFYGFASVFVIAEVSAKLSMNMCLMLGKGSEGTEGLGTLFIRSSTPQKHLAALVSAVLIAILFTASFRFCIVFTGIIVGVLVSYIAKRKFGGISGDVVGASNELARCATLLIWAVLFSLRK
ncbi:MAG: adenosylcobinamide-GDP ribazoletransferase [Candidatus Methanospirareceae archaeon]